MRIPYLMALLCFGSISMRAQQDSVQKTTSTTLALLYNSNISYYGQATADKFPYLLANATVRFPIGIYLSAGGYQLLNYGPALSEADLGIGYERTFKEKWNASVAYTRSFFPTNSPLLAAANSNNINLSIAYAGSFLKNTVDVDYAFGKEQDVFITLTNSKEFELGTLFNEKNLISIAPAIEVVAGTRHFYETYVIAEEKRNNGKGKGAGNAPINTTTSTNYIEKDSFNLLSYNFKIPLSFSRASYLIEANYQFSILGKKADANLRSQYSIFGFACYYQF
jgi:hypothetical protein